MYKWRTISFICSGDLRVEFRLKKEFETQQNPDGDQWIAPAGSMFRSVGTGRGSGRSKWSDKLFGREFPELKSSFLTAHLLTAPMISQPPLLTCAPLALTARPSTVNPHSWLLDLADRATPPTYRLHPSTPEKSKGIYCFSIAQIQTIRKYSGNKVRQGNSGGNRLRFHNRLSEIIGLLQPIDYRL